MVSAYIYLEGGASGANSKNLTIRCQQAFHKLLDQMGFKGRKPRLKACGGRDSVFNDFCTAHKAGGDGYAAMWIDSEEPIADLEQAWKHLAEVKTVAAWKKPDSAEDDPDWRRKDEVTLIQQPGRNPQKFSTCSFLSRSK
jgi:hypothetical protein